MIASSFDESTGCFSRPVDMTKQERNPLSIADGIIGDGIPVVISCWKLTSDEVEEVWTDLADRGW